MLVYQVTTIVTSIIKKNGSLQSRPHLQRKKIPSFFKKRKTNKDKQGCMLNIELICQIFNLSFTPMFGYKFFFFNHPNLACVIWVEEVKVGRL